MKEDNVKQFVFRYQKANDLNLGSLKRGEIYFANIAELNDGNEGRPHLILQGNLEAYKRFFDWLFFSVIIKKYPISSKSDWLKFIELADFCAVNLKKEYKNKDLCISEVPEALNKILSNKYGNKIPKQFTWLYNESLSFIHHKIDSDVQNRFCSTSFSKTALNPTMWGHYAEADKGYVIVFKTSESKISVKFSSSSFTTFKEKESVLGKTVEIGCSSHGEIKLEPIIYRQKRPKINVVDWFANQFSFTEEEMHYDYDAHFCSSMNQKAIDTFMLHKSKDWKYEQEQRLLHYVGATSFDKCTLPENRVANISGLYSIIIGFKASDYIVDRIIESAKQLVESSYEHSPNKLFIFKTVPDPESYQYKLKPFGKIELVNQICKFTDKSLLTVEDIEEMDKLRIQITLG